MHATGAKLVAISPQTLENNAKVRDQQRLTFPVLLDASNAYARSLSLVFELPEDLRGVYGQFGIDLPSAHGGGAWELPLPTRLVVDREGVIRSVDAEVDYTRRPEPEATLDVLRSLA